MASPSRLDRVKYRRPYSTRWELLDLDTAMDLIADRAATRGRRRSPARRARSVFLAGSADRVFVELGVPYRWQVWGYRVGVLVVPPLAGWVALRVARELRGAYPAIRAGTE